MTLDGRIWAGGSCHRSGSTIPALRLLLGMVPQIGATPRQERSRLTATSTRG